MCLPAALTCDLQSVTICIAKLEEVTAQYGYNASYILQTGETDDEIRLQYADYCRSAIKPLHLICYINFKLTYFLLLTYMYSYSRTVVLLDSILEEPSVRLAIFSCGSLLCCNNATVFNTRENGIEF